MKCKLLLRNGFIAAVGMALCVSGCVVVDGDVQSVFTMGRKESQRTEVLSHPLPDRRTLKIESSFGSIEVTGSDTTECRVEASIHTRAKSTSQAQRILSQVKLHLDETATGLRLYWDKPPVGKGESVGVSFVVLVPRRTDLDCLTSFGKIEIMDIANNVKANTGFAGIRCIRIEGDLELDTKYGDIRCHEILSTNMSLKTSFGEVDLRCLDLEPYQKPGTAILKTEHGKIVAENLAARQIVAHTSFGNIDIHCAPIDIEAVNADLETSYGSIDFDTPGRFAGKVHLTTSYGSVKTELPVTVEGKGSSTRLVGKIGAGSGDLRLHTSFGSIVLR